MLREGRSIKGLGEAEPGVAAAGFCGSCAAGISGMHESAKAGAQVACAALMMSSGEGRFRAAVCGESLIAPAAEDIV